MTRRAGILLVPFVLALAGAAAWLYFSVLRPTPRADRHVPRGANIAVRADAFEILTFKPVREHLWPVLIAGKRRESQRPDARLDRLQRATGVRIPDDLREAVLASVDGRQWVVAIGGRIAPGRFVTGLFALLRDSGVAGWTRDGDLLLGPLGAAIGQADDGTLVAGTGKGAVLAALPQRDEPDPAEWPLPERGAISFLLTSAAFRGALGALPTSAPGFDALAEIDRLSGTVTLSEAPRLDLRIVPRGVAPDKLASDLRAALGAWSSAVLLLPGDLGDVAQDIGSATVEAQSGEVHLGAGLPYAQIDHAVARLADRLAGVMPR